jgi:hypothetical protein
MTGKRSGAHAIKDHQRQGTARDKEHRQRRVQDHKRSALVRSIADAVVIKDQDVFFLSERNGRVPGGTDHGYGLYYDDCRYLNTYDMQLVDTAPNTLIAVAQQGYGATLALTNPDIRMKDGSLIEKEEIGIKWERLILAVHFTPGPEHTAGTRAQYRVKLGGRQSTQILVRLAIAESKKEADVRPAKTRPPDFGKLEQSVKHSAKDWLERQAHVRSNSPVLDEVVGRSLADLPVLRSTLDGQHYFAAGVPWYVTLFGRDSLTAGLQALAYEPEVAAHTLRLLARYQGTRVDEWRDEQPGKIMHELRAGELANTNEIPQTPYYGTIDATPLLLVLLARHAAWTGSLNLFRELRDNVERALAWMADYGDPTGAGYLAYQVKSKKGLGNQGWKDSGDSIVNADGSLAKPPIALAEVQGYVYLAKMSLADLYGRAGDEDRARGLVREAEDLRQRFNRDFWLKDRGVYALAPCRPARSPAWWSPPTPGRYCGRASPSGTRPAGRRSSCCRRRCSMAGAYGRCPPPSAATTRSATTSGRSGRTTIP